MRTLKFILPLFLLLAPSIVWSKTFDGFAVTNAGDTIYCQFEVPVNPFHGTVSPIRAQRRAIVKNKQGKTSKIFPTEHRSYTLLNTKEGDMTFESVRCNGKQMFLHLRHRGKLTFYTLYDVNSYDYSLVAKHCLQLGDGSLVELSNWTWRTKLSKLFYLDEFFAREKREKKYTYFDIVAFAKAYDAYEPDVTKR